MEDLLYEEELAATREICMMTLHTLEHTPLWYHWTLNFQLS